jgi:hypothetical protein
MRKVWNHATPVPTQPCPENNTSTLIAEQVAWWFCGPDSVLIHPEVAMEIAAWWDSFSNHGLHTFATTGTITETLLDEINAELAKIPSDFNARHLDALAAYVRAVPETWGEQ